MPNQVKYGRGLALAVVSAATFCTSGSFGSVLIDQGWSAAAAVTARLVVAALVLTAPALWQLRGKWHQMRAALPMVTVYGLVAVAGCQVGFFNAVQHLSVGIALLLEYLGTFLVVGWLWLRHGQRPRRLTVLAGVVAVAGLTLILDVFGSVRLSPVGVCWGLAAAFGLAFYFTVSSRVDEALPPLAMAWGGMSIGAAALLVLGAVGALPMAANRNDVILFHSRVDWIVPVLGLSLVAAVVAYVAGIAAARELGAKVSSFVGLTEVLFAVLVAWLVLGQAPTTLQAAGGALILAGVVLVRIDELREPVPAGELPETIPVG